MNNDGAVDLVTANLDSEDISVLLGVGNGYFTAAIHTSVSDVPRAIAAGDLDEDGHLDIAAVNLRQSRVSVLLGQGDGTFAAERRFLLLPPGEGGSSEPRSVALGDLDRDGHLDIVAGSVNRDAVAVLLGDGTGDFGAAAETEVGNFPLAVKLADLNADGRPDLVFVSTNDPDDSGDQAQPRVVRVLGVGDGGFDDDTNTRYTVGAAPRDLAVADLNGDGFPDAVSVHPGDDSLYILAGRSGGRLSGGDRERAYSAPNSVAAADLNGDGRPDLLTTHDGHTAGVLLNRGGLAINSVMHFYAGASPIAGISADVNGDGRADVILANRSSDDVSVLLAAP